MPKQSIPKFTQQERDLVREAFHAKENHFVTARRLNELDCNKRLKPRSGYSVYRQQKALGLYRPFAPATLPQLPASSHSNANEELQNWKGDIAFKKAMLRARNSGAEHVAIGVVKDRRPLRATHFHAEHIFSACGSPGALCGEMGSSGSRGPSDSY